MSLESLRKEIDGMNELIISTLSRRLEVAKKISKEKRKVNLPIIDSAREMEIITFFEKEFVNRGMKKKTGYILARAIIDAAIEEEQLNSD